MPAMYDYLLLGGGTSCAYAAAAIRETDQNGSIGIVGASGEPPYDRPPFSKYYLTDASKQISDFHSKDESFYPDNQIDLVLNHRAVNIDRSAKQVEFENGSKIAYGKLLYALGCTPREFHDHTDQEPMYLRTAEDSKAIRDRIASSKSCVIIGGGYIGTELAASLTARGLKVALIEQADRLQPGFPSRPVADAVRRELESMGVTVVTGEPVSHVYAGRRVITASDHEYSGDFVVAGLGHVHQRDLAKNCGLEMGMRGVRANMKLRTSDPNIWVSGDVAEFDDTVLGDVYIAEHHLHAKATAEHAGRVMAGLDEPFKNVPYFFSDVGPLSIILRGYPERGAQSFVFGNPTSPAITEIFLSSTGRLMGMVDVRRDYKQQDPISEMFENLIKNRVNLSSHIERLNNPNFDLTSLNELVSV
jgi:3-phenylpropionate/trans-cinnamate dioxygenase ferredoxin reductase subunit